MFDRATRPGADSPHNTNDSLLQTCIDEAFAPFVANAKLRKEFDHYAAGASLSFCNSSNCLQAVGAS